MCGAAGARGVRRVSITLDDRILGLPTTRLRDVWSTMMHEMVHAYLKVECGTDSDLDDPGGDVAHGVCFRRCLAAVQRGLGGKLFVELDVTHTLTRREGEDRRWESGYRPVGGARRAMGGGGGRRGGRGRRRREGGLAGVLRWLCWS